ncbi:MAG: 1-acyl-sn-glycerol-3-phosphate acyltransferase [Verrucomicrobia bacterium]|nr:1-acyl-sn-glycerol-3-phosphate acyltransferase [Verrucomicrobiota bacterium]
MQGWLRNSNNLLYKVVLFSVYWFFAILYRNKIYGRSHFPKGAAILAANHVSFYDPPLLSISTPYEVHFLARKTLFDIPLFGTLIRKLNAHPVSGKAQDVAVFKTIVRLMKEGKKVIIFPEGKRSVNGQLQPMKPGISLLISRTDAAVVPSYLHGTFTLWPSKKKLPKLWGKTACVFGKPLYFSKDTPQEEISQQIENSILALKDWYEKGARGPIP